ncbi:probable DNA metabolism protein [uncultured Roseburia sp.]|uniref:TIGR03915 family putative DNA repair protein n=1 Tax=Brotonthovivens ammoniilytica TaxID=2981725 RepID=A0ABT2TG18_9FIRM|nr:TIGR03915 family putative DNA repair protein [Brotonthovivens ammoniilytica]MCU6761122.1 TIGR03915 family putative DNA repair protein [Brotonthovivens ammoniilytica]SCI19545.1 probable DNA metabolism protein [uncultured Roseburia sp.]
MTIFTCDDTFEAMMSCIYDAWASGHGHQNIRLKTEPIGNLELFCEYVHITADTAKSQRVIHAVRKKISHYAYEMVYRCAMSCSEDKLDIIYRFLLLGFSQGAKVTNMLQQPAVMNLFKQNRAVINETHLFREFVRFNSAKNGILVSFIEPKSNLLTLLSPAFDDRIPSENWMIIDKSHMTAAVHQADNETYFTPLTHSELKQISNSLANADQYIELWKDFFKTTGIRERFNPVCQRPHLPVWYRKNVTEFL